MTLLVFLLLGLGNLRDFRYAKVCINSPDGPIACCIANMGDNDYLGFDGRTWRGDESKFFLVRARAFRCGWLYLGPEQPK